MRDIFVAGTDTGCGKTRVACAVAAAARARGLRVRVLKPVETGCADGARGRIPADALALARAAGDSRAASELCPYALALPAAPIVAARCENVLVELPVVERAHARARREADLVVTEAAGGLCVPVAPELDTCDLAKALALPVLLVARARLGTTNHTLLSLREAERRGLEVLGVVISHTEPELSSADRQNLDWLLGALPVPHLGELHHSGSEDPLGSATDGPSPGAPGVDWGRLWELLDTN